MTYTEDISRAGEYLRLTLASLARHRLTASPVNYTVWYDAVSGRNLKLKKALDKLVASGEPITEKGVQALYQQFVTDGDRLVISRLLTKVNLMLREITGHVLETGGDLADHGQSLESLAEALETAEDFEGVREIIDQMLEASRAIMKSGTRLHKRMKVSSEDLQQLQRELEASQEQAMTDSLTGLANRRGLDKRMELERIRAKQNQAPFSVILFDIDHFKRINDEFGHLVGDSMLKGMARILKAMTRRNDLVARFGGEEFLVLLPETDIPGAVAVAEKVRSLLAQKEWKVKDSGRVIGQVSASMGIASFQMNESDSRVIERADKALYQAKNRGRDQVVVFEETLN